jgi:hypothetical protein
LLDFSLSFGTGRRTTLSVDDITQVIPTQDDMRPALASHETSDRQQQLTSHGRSPFPYAARQMLAYGQLINLLNGPAEDTPERTEALRKARSLVIDVYNQLPPDMLWSATKWVPLVCHRVKRGDRLMPRSLQIHRQAHQSPIFLHLHLWMHAMIVSSLRISSSTLHSQSLLLYSKVLSPSLCDGLPRCCACLQQQQNQCVLIPAS